MNARKLLDALNGVEEKYIREADVFQPAEEAPERASGLRRALSFAGGLAACAAVLAGLILMGKYGLLDPIETGPQGTDQSEACMTAAVSTADREIAESAPEPDLQDAETSSAMAAHDTASLPVPLEELPQLTFPTREEAGDRGGQAIGCGPELTEVSLTQEQIAAIWGQEGDLAWEGLLLSGSSAEYNSSGTAYYNEDGKLAYLSLEVKRKKALAPECSFTVEIAPGHINSLGTHMTAPPSRACGVWGTEVTTLAAYNNDENFAALSISFLTGPEGEPGTLGVTAKSMIWELLYNGWTLKDGEELLTRLASQCLRPENVFDISHLETVENLDGKPVSSTPEPEKSGVGTVSSVSEAEKDYNVRIISDGNLYEDGDGYLYGNPSTFPSGACCAFQDGKAVLTGDEAAAEAGDESCVRVLRLNLPLVLVKNIEPAIGERSRQLCALYSVDYGFFERDGEKIIQKIGGYGDAAGVITTPRGGAVNYNAWYPKDGDRYFPSIVEFIGGDESVAEKAIQQAHDWPEKAKAHAEELLASYMAQNGLTGWKMKALDKDGNEALTPFGPKKGELEEAAKLVAQQYADSWLSMSEPGYPPLTECFYTDLSWAESPNPDSDIQVSCKLVFRLLYPEDGLGNWSAGNTAPGTGKHEGYYTAFRFIYAKQENGRWVITGSGTGP